MKTIRLPESATTQEIAKWLTQLSEEEWTERAVLSRLLEWERHGDEKSESLAYLPDTLTVVIRARTELICLTKECVPVTLNYPRRYKLCPPLEPFIENLEDVGEALPPTLTDGVNRYRCQYPIRLEDVRLRREWAEQLLPSFDRLILEVSRGEHPELIEALDSETAEQDWATSNQASVSKYTNENDIPGEPPHTANGQLAVKAAFQIECETGRAANAKAVMERLQLWADRGMEPETLIRSDKGRRGVWWNTGKNEKLYDLEACRKCLAGWMKSRV